MTLNPILVPTIQLVLFLQFAHTHLAYFTHHTSLSLLLPPKSPPSSYFTGTQPDVTRLLFRGQKHVRLDSYVSIGCSPLAFFHFQHPPPHLTSITLLELASYFCPPTSWAWGNKSREPSAVRTEYRALIFGSTSNNRVVRVGGSTTVDESITVLDTTAAVERQHPGCWLINGSDTRLGWRRERRCLKRVGNLELYG